MHHGMLPIYLKCFFFNISGINKVLLLLADFDTLDSNTRLFIESVECSY